MNKTKIDPNSRDYDLSSIEPDERFTQTFKEFLITAGTYIVFAALMIINLFTLGSTPVEEYTYVFGIPLWIFVEILILVGMVVAEELIVSFVYKDMDVTPNGSIRK